MHNDVITVNIKRRGPSSGLTSPDGYRSDHMQACVTRAVTEPLPLFAFLSSVITLYKTTGSNSLPNPSKLCDILQSICVDESFSPYSDGSMALLDCLEDLWDSPDLSWDTRNRYISTLRDLIAKVSADYPFFTARFDHSPTNYFCSGKTSISEGDMIVAAPTFSSTAIMGNAFILRPANLFGHQDVTSLHDIAPSNASYKLAGSTFIWYSGDTGDGGQNVREMVRFNLCSAGSLQSCILPPRDL
jgi:hypothetical protein